MHQVDEELPVPLRTGQPGVYDAGRDRTPRPCGFDDAFEDLSLHLGIADDAFRDVTPSRLELRLHEDEPLPARRREREHRRQRLRHADERDVADDKIGRERQLPQRSCVDAFEHGDAGIRPQPRMELAVADVDRDDAGSSRLQQAVREAPGRRSDVRAGASRHVDRERIQRVLQLLAAA